MNKYYSFTKDNGAASYDSYPYLASDGVCKQDAGSKVARATSW